MARWADCFTNVRYCELGTGGSSDGSWPFGPEGSPHSSFSVGAGSGPSQMNALYSLATRTGPRRMAAPEPESSEPRVDTCQRVYAASVLGFATQPRWGQR